MNITVVAAVTRPELIGSVVEAFERQSFASKKLVLVLNGSAIDVQAPKGERHMVHRCEGGTPARARNAGLRVVQSFGGEVVSFWDDDDYYGPGYLDDVAVSLAGRPRRVVGKHARFVRYDDGLNYLLGRQGSFLGGTISAWASGLPQIPDLARDEDRVWCQELAAAGYELTTLSARHYVYNRRSGHHAWRSPKLQMLYGYGPALSFGMADDSLVDTSLQSASAEFVPRPSVEDVSNELRSRLVEKELST